jgi:hypothetical protein
VNCSFAWVFGLRYTDMPANITVMIGYFLAGFVCGMAVLGIYAVWHEVPTLSEKAELDFTSPDGSGGTLFVGEALVVFAAVTLIIGVMISVYILKAWPPETDPWWVIVVKGIWIAFPYAMSLLVFVGPAVALNNKLTSYKTSLEVKFQERLATIRAALDQNQSDAAELKGWREKYAFLLSDRAKLHEMRTWPYGLGANLKYFCVFVANFSATAESTLKWAEKIPTTSKASLLKVLAWYDPTWIAPWWG